jgi:hypothetical protein
MDVHVALDESDEVVDRVNTLQRLALVGPLRLPISIAEIRVCKIQVSRRSAQVP